MTTATPALPLPTRDPRSLAAALTERGIQRGRRSMTAITRLRRERAGRQDVRQEPGLRERLTARLLDTAVAEIRRRGGETVIESKDSVTRLAITDRVPRLRMLVVHCDGWRWYGRRHGFRRASLSYLCGHDDAGPWAVRVPGTITNVATAVDWITPAEVRDAYARGRRVQRQGDVYAVETHARNDGVGADQLPAAHRWNPTTRYLVHHPEDGRKHRPVRATYPVKFVVQRVYEMGRTNSRANGD